MIGCGKMGLEHIKLIRMLKNVNIAAVADPKFDASVASDIVDENTKVYNNVENMLHEIRPDAVHVITPPDTHYLTGKLALESGANVFIEKPFVPTLANAEELFQIANHKKVHLFAGHQLLAQDVTLKAETLIPLIGDIAHIESYFSFRKVRRSLSPVEQTIDILPHPAYTLLHFMSLKNSNDELRLNALETDSNGEVRALVRKGQIYGALTITLQGRPVDSYLKIIGSNGSITIDFVRGIVIQLTGTGADAVSAITSPYRQALQLSARSTKAFFAMALKKNKSYNGLQELIQNFYSSIRGEDKPFISKNAVIEVVKLSEIISSELVKNEIDAEKKAEERFLEKSQFLPTIISKQRVMVTGGNGFLGRVICQKLRRAGYEVISLSRNLPRFQDREPGIKYRSGDLSRGLKQDTIKDIDVIVHCAAETSGGKEDHQKNSIDATKKLIKLALSSNIQKFIHMSSIAVLKPGKDNNVPLDENSPMDLNNLARGPYVWGKSISEELVKQANSTDFHTKIIRLGPLVDFEHFAAPGRLGREVGSFFVVMGNPSSLLSICNVHTVSSIVHYMIENYKDSPTLLNLVEPEVPTRADLISKLLLKRKDLTPVYIPSFVVNTMSKILIGVQKVLKPSKKPIDISAAFSSENYDTMLASKIVQKAPK